MIVKRNHNERGPTNAGWLKSQHTFSFGHYFDNKHMGFGPLRVINEDRVVAGAGFQTHPHSNMEIISYVIDGELEHKDSMGNGSTIVPGEIQLMSAGTGVTHSEFNGSNESEVHFLQIWVMPNVENQEPSYQQKMFDPAELNNTFRAVISPDGTDDSLVIKQDARMMSGKFDEGAETDVPVSSARKYWLQIVRGDIELNGEQAQTGDGLSIKGEAVLRFRSITPSEVLLFDLP